VEEPIKNEVQESIEKTAQLTDMLFGAPSPGASYLVILASSVAGLTLAPDLGGVFPALLAGILLVALPSAVAAVASTPVASALGGTLYHPRSAFLAAVGSALLGVAMVGAMLFGFLFDINPVHGLVLGYALVLALRHTVLFVMSNTRHAASLPVTILPYLVAAPLMPLLLPIGPREAFLMLALPALHVAISAFVLRLFDAPIRKNFGVSAFDLFRYFLDHFHTGNPHGETLMEHFAEPVQAKVGVLAFRRPSQGTIKAAIVVPALHPGPVGELGGGDMPGKIAQGVKRAEHVLVPHGPATHDLNPISTKEVERVGKAVDEALGKLTWEEGGSRFCGGTRGVRVGSQFFGKGALLTYTSWPEPIDDVSYGVGHAAELSARIAGAGEAVFVDCHNSLTPGAGAVFTNTPRADRIVELAHDTTAEAAGEKVPTLRVGVAQSTGFRREDGIGKQGVQAIAVEAGGQRVAYVLWDGNNMLPKVTEAIGQALEGLVDRFQVMTTDNHSVNAIAGGFNPVGHRITPDEVAKATKQVVQRAFADLEPVQCGATRVVIPGVRVFGHDKTARLTSSINTMASQAPQVMVVWALLVGMASALLLLASRALA
jgi:putative membrane protein